MRPAIELASRNTRQCLKRQERRLRLPFGEAAGAFSVPFSFSFYFFLFAPLFLEASLYSFISAAVRNAPDGGSFELDAGNTENLRQKALENGRLAAGKHIE